MAVIQVKKYKLLKDGNGNKIQVPKPKDEWNKETKNGTATWYFSERYEISGHIHQFKSKVFALKREAEEQDRLFLNNPIEYIQNNSKRAKNNLESTEAKSNNEKVLNDYFQDFNKYKLQYIKGNSVREDKENWENHLSKEFGTFTPKEITLGLIKNWHLKINDKTYIVKKTNEEKSYSISSKNKWHSTLSEFLDYLCMEGLLEINYAKVIGNFKTPNENKNKNNKIKYQTLDEFNLFIDIVDDLFWQAFFKFLFWHGCRIGEQRAIKIKDIDFEHDIIHFHETYTRDVNGKEAIGPIKNNQERYTYLSKRAKDDLIKLINIYKEMDGYTNEWFLFGGSIALSKNMIQRKLDHYYDKLKIKYPGKKINRLSHHEFGRHSRASYFLNVGLEKGLPLDEILSLIAQQLGDTVDVIRSTYAHPYEDKNIDKIKKIFENE